MSGLELFSDEWWDITESEFAVMAEDVQHITLESYEEALARVPAPEGSGYHPETGDLILGIPYLRGASHEYLREIVAENEKLLSLLEGMFEARRPSAEFIHAVTRFNFTYGYIAAIVMYAGDDLGPERAKLAYVKKKWVSHLIARRLSEGRDRQRAERDVAKAISNLVEQGGLSGAFPVEWYEELLGPDGQLRPAYTGKALTREELLRLAQESTTDIPSTDIRIPET
jgi:hypothetical protein